MPRVHRRKAVNPSRTSSTISAELALRPGIHRLEMFSSISRLEYCFAEISTAIHRLLAEHCGFQYDASTSPAFVETFGALVLELALSRGSRVWARQRFLTSPSVGRADALCGGLSFGVEDFQAKLVPWCSEYSMLADYVLYYILYTLILFVLFYSGQHEIKASSPVFGPPELELKHFKQHHEPGNAFSCLRTSSPHVKCIWHSGSVNFRRLNGASEARQMKDGWRMIKVCHQVLWLPWWMCSLLWFSRSLNHINSCDLFTVDFNLIWSCVSQVWCCYDNAKSKMFASLDSHWGLSWDVHGAVPEGKTWENLPFASICTSCWQFEHSLRESPEIGRNARNPIDPDHPWPSRTPSLIIPISRMQLWSRVCVSCPACPVQVWSFRFVQPVSLGCMTTVWWYSWWSLNFGKLWSWFATLFLHLGRVQWFLWDTWCQIDSYWYVKKDWCLHDWSPGNPIRPALWSHKRRPGMHEVARSVFSVFLLRLLTVICHLQRPGAAFFFLPDLGSHQNRPKPSRIPDSRKGFPWQLSLTVEGSQFSVRQVNPKTSRRWWRARFRSKRLIHCDFIVHVQFLKDVMKNKISNRISEKSGRSAVQTITLQFDPEPIDNQWTLIHWFWNSEGLPFPCSQKGCSTFHENLHGYCQRHRFQRFSQKLSTQFHAAPGFDLSCCIYVMFGIIMSSIVLSVGTQSFRTTSSLENKETMS